MSQSEFAGLLKRRDAARAAYAKAMSKYDAVVTLGACGAAPVGRRPGYYDHGADAAIFSLAL